MINKFALATLAIFSLLTGIFTPLPAYSADLSKFNAGNIIDDQVFFNGSSMSVQEVQTFLNRQVPTCTINNGMPSHAAGAPYRSTFISNSCLRDYAQQTPNMAAQPGICSPFQGQAWETAASIIARVGLACNVSPKVLLVLLEKEQSLVTDTWPTVAQIDSATGFACYDNGLPCVKTYAGFFYQVYAAASQFQRYGTGSLTWFPVGQVSSVAYQADDLSTPQNENILCGSKAIRIENRATAALYYYTPYTPNDAALAAGYGLGDNCSAYGNRNFYQLFVDWFGSTRYSDPYSPVGNIDVAKSSIDKVRIAGWTFDPETSQPINVHLYVNGGWGGEFRASVLRPDVAIAYPSYGAAHGFEISFPTPTATFEACLYAINVGNGAHSKLGCRTLSPPSGSPFGSLDSSVVKGLTVELFGWLIDPDTADSVDLHAYVNGNWGGAFTANQSREDVGRAYSGYGNNHGFRLQIPLTAGSNNVCLFAINAGFGNNQLVGCQTVSTISGNPFGNFEALSVQPGVVNASGWLIDPENPSNSYIHAYIDGAWAGAFSTQSRRADVTQTYPGTNITPGYSLPIQFSLPRGSHTLCLFGINFGFGTTNPLLGCRSFTSPGGNPFGSVDSIVWSDNTLRMNGWVIDPDSTLPVNLHIYVDGGWGGQYTSNTNRPDVGLAYPTYGSDHGYGIELPVDSSSRQACVYAINVGEGYNQKIGCANR